MGKNLLTNQPRLLILAPSRIRLWVVRLHSYLRMINHSFFFDHFIKFLGDTTRDIYKWSEKRTTPQFQRKRRMSDSEIGSAVDATSLKASQLREPGMFRRHFIASQAMKQGTPAPNFITHNFIDFLALYGYFGGDVYPSDYDTDYDSPTEGIPEEDEEGDENQPLLASSAAPRSRIASQTHIKGTTEKKAFFMLMKAFVGTGVLFLPKAFSQGGMGFSIILLFIIGWLTLHCMLLLVDTSRELGGSFGDIGEKLYGPKAKALVLWSIAVSQVLNLALKSSIKLVDGLLLCVLHLCGAESS